MFNVKFLIYKEKCMSCPESLIRTVALVSRNTATAKLQNGH